MCKTCNTDKTNVLLFYVFDENFYYWHILPIYSLTSTDSDLTDHLICWPIPDRTSYMCKIHTHFLI